MMKFPFSVLVPLFASLVFHGANADTVYQWTDEEGIVHFSDVPPGEIEPGDVREITIASYEDPDADPDRYSIINQVERMEERRRQLAEERLAKKQLQLEARRLAQQEAISNSYAFSTVPEYQTYYLYSGPRRSYFSPRGIYHRKDRGYGYFSGHQYRNHRSGRSGHGYNATGYHGRNSRGINVGIRF